MVPLTNALYVRGTVEDVKTVLVDVGTGYFAEKSTEEGILVEKKQRNIAQEYMDRRIEALKQNLMMAQNALSAKRTDYQAISQVYQYKVAQFAKNSAPLKA